MIRGGFEASCVDLDGSRYLWHGSQGIRTDPRHCTTTPITDPALLPDLAWHPTPLGAEEIAAKRRE